MQIKTRKYNATPIKGVAQEGNFLLTMARKTSVDVSRLDSMPEAEPENGQKARNCEHPNEGGCFTCCSTL